MGGAVPIFGIAPFFFLALGAHEHFRNHLTVYLLVKRFKLQNVEEVAD